MRKSPNLRLLSIVLSLSLLGSLAFAQIAEVTAVGVDTRTVAHAFGETEVPLAPARVVALHNIFSEALIALDVIPAAATERISGVAIQLQHGLEGVPSIGEKGSPDFEAILALEPDLILGQAGDHGEFYQLLSAIAPTVLLNEPDAEWREWFIGLGGVLGLSATAEATVEAYDAEAARVRDLVAEARPGETVLLLRVREKDIRVYGGNRRSGPVLYIDLALPPHHLVPLEEDSVTVSNEIIPELDADHIFLMVEDEDRMAGIEATALWQQLPAVVNGQAYRVNIEPWNRSTGPISFAEIVSDVARLLLPGEGD